MFYAIDRFDAKKEAFVSSPTKEKMTIKRFLNLGKKILMP
jgi:hypothetical protein